MRGGKHRRRASRVSDVVAARLPSSRGICENLPQHADPSLQRSGMPRARGHAAVLAEKCPGDPQARSASTPARRSIDGIDKVAAASRDERLPRRTSGHDPHSIDGKHPYPSARRYTFRAPPVFLRCYATRGNDELPCSGDDDVSRCRMGRTRSREALRLGASMPRGPRCRHAFPRPRHDQRAEVRPFSMRRILARQRSRGCCGSIRALRQRPQPGQLGRNDRPPARSKSHNRTRAADAREADIGARVASGSFAPAVEDHLGE